MSDLTASNAFDAVPVQATSDEHLRQLWLDGRPDSTKRAYNADIDAFLAFAGCDLRRVTVGTVQAYGATLAEQATTTRARKLSSIKSLLTFAHRLGYIAFNVGGAVRLPKIENRLAERIADTDTVAELIALEPNERNKTVLTLMYRAGLRISEVAGLEWRHVQPHADGGGQLAIYGKGGKTRHVRIGPKLYARLEALKTPESTSESLVFRSRQGNGRMALTTLDLVVKTAAKRAGIPDLSAHWLRHAHASHALDNGAPVHLVQTTLGHASLSTTSRYAHARPDDSSERYLGGK
jgi:integrase/recombinase XerD